ncbi:glycoside hydrolase family 31 protein [Paenibacillus sp. MBLB4367]|uniref:glycoside hydrolase family 31 protein n=1 Tax=Paenibacillus sp. MBLB4367 TaxID=3384767 RepID=UPI0039082657
MERNRLELDLLQGEYWWGGVVCDGAIMPFGGGKETERNMHLNLRGNQGAPLLLSSKGRSVWSEETFRFRVTADKLIVEVADGEIRFDAAASDLPEAFRRAAQSYFPADEQCPDPLFFTAPQYNTWIEMTYEPTQDKTIAYAESVLANGMPPGVIMIDDNWMQDYGVWKFHPGRFPDPRAMTDKLHELGFKVMLWTCPFVSPDSESFRYLEQKGWLLRGEDGETAIRRWWNGLSAVLDCTNAAAVDWYHEQLRILIDRYGIDGFKFDAGDPEFYRASDKSAVPLHPNGHCEAWANVGLRYPLNEYRACWKNAGKPLVQRLRDKSHSWGNDGLASLIPDGLAQGLLGYAFACPDMIGGGQVGDVLNDDFTVKSAFQLDQELFVRYAQCSALFPMMQFSAAPWRVLDSEHLALCVEAANLHAQFGDEIMALAQQAAETGEPIMRHLAYVYPEGGYENVNDQFMLGDSVLVAPMLAKGAASRSVAFPPGSWRGDDGSTVEGPCVRDVNAPLSRLPWYRRQA